ncbi:MAG: DUF3187 family protein [Gammaproteobacteria bacterium]|nr:DUF3187 family protein [Gammaproteobacteria bacterium]
MHRFAWGPGLAAACLVHVAVAAGGPAARDFGPLRIRDQFVLGMGFLAFDPIDAHTLPPGHSRVEAVLTQTNTFASSGAVEQALETRPDRRPVGLDFLRGFGDRTFFLDGEVSRLAVAMSHGLTPRLQIELTAQMLRFGGGFQDAVIEEFHRGFGLDQKGRLGAPRNAFTVYVRTPERELFIDGPNRSGLSDTVLSMEWALLAPEAPAQLALQGLAKLPTGNNDALFSTGSLDYGVQLAGSWDLHAGCLHGAVGVLRLGEWELLGIDEQTLLSAMAAYEQAIGEARSVIGQLTYSQSPFEDLGIPELGKDSIQMSLGFKQRLDEHRRFFLALTENVQNFDNTADVGFHVGYVQEFP